MKIVFIGGGPASVYSALLIKKKNPKYEVLIFEKEKELLKKFKATGNGKCNILNISDDPNKYNNPDFIDYYLKKFPYPVQKKLIEEQFHIKLKEENGLVYPINESSATTALCLIQQIEKLGIKYDLNHRLLNYKRHKNGFELAFSNGDTLKCDVLIISTGGKSTPNLGSDGFIFPLLEKKYKIEETKPSLVGLKLKENVKKLTGKRIKGLVTLLDNDKEIKKEKGEVIFKNDGISGIVIMNMSSYINFYKVKKPIIKLNLSFNITKDELKENNSNLKNVLFPYLEKDIANYIYDSLNLKYGSNLTDEEIERIINYIQNIKFEVTDTYGFNNSQVTSGGIELNEIDSNFESKKEKSLYFIGEILDIDGICGGFNLKWALISAYFLSLNFIN